MSSARSRLWSYPSQLARAKPRLHLEQNCAFDFVIDAAVHTERSLDVDLKILPPRRFALLIVLLVRGLCQPHPDRAICFENVLQLFRLVKKFVGYFEKDRVEQTNTQLLPFA